MTPAELAGLTERSDNRGFENYLWHFMKDKNTFDDISTVGIDETFINGQEYVTLWNQSGIAWNEGGRSANPKKSYLYFAAKFTIASVGAEYETSMLTLEAYRGISVLPIYLYKDAPLTQFPTEPGATLENHYAPSGWMNVKAGDLHMEVDAKCKDVTPHSGTHCFKFIWNGKAGRDGGKWGGIVWLEPEDIWAYGGSSPTHNGYDLRGAGYLRFWARVDANNVGLRIKHYVGNDWDSCGKVSTAAWWCEPALNTTWQEYSIYVGDKNMSNVTGGLAIVFDKAHDVGTDGFILYLDDIRFDQ